MALFDVHRRELCRTIAFRFQSEIVSLLLSFICTAFAEFFGCHCCKYHCQYNTLGPLNIRYIESKNFSVAAVRESMTHSAGVTHLSVCQRSM